MTIQVEILSNGSFLVKKGNQAHNDIILRMFKDMDIDTAELENFFSINGKSEILFGEELCG